MSANLSPPSAEEVETLATALARTFDRFSVAQRKAAADALRSLSAENARLNQSLRYEQHREGRIGTHGVGCYSWGPHHYECALAERDALTARVGRLLTALEPFSDVSGEGDEDFPDDMPVTVQFGRTTHYALNLGHLREAARLAQSEDGEGA